MRLAKSEKAVSTVIATLLMINIAFTTGVLVFAWAQGLFGSWASTSGVYFQTKGESIEEDIALVNLRFLSPAPNVHTLNITVRNIGHRDVQIASIYLNNTNVISQVSQSCKPWNNIGATVPMITSGPQAGTYLIASGDAVTFAFVTVTGLESELRNGGKLTVVVATQRGSRAVQQWETSG
jgi:FlaG/FlaF family flagellin (archaellin)